MASKTNEVITGDYDHYGRSIVYGDTDSEISTTRHLTNFGEKTIEDLFNSCKEFWKDKDKEYAYDPELMVMTYDEDIDEPYMGHTEYIYRHKVSKDLYEIEDELGNVITVTEDHSVMVERNGFLIDVKPVDILESDIMISIKVNDK
jgi:intein/homing endonuclease